MKLYDFSLYAERRDARRREQAAREAVIEVIAEIDKPGSVVQLKQRVDGWFVLHRDVLGRSVDVA